MTANQIIEQFQLLTHPEGGHYKETYRSDYSIPTDVGEIRNVCTAIYFMLSGNEKSHFHRIRSDELWFFHIGKPLIIYWIDNDNLKSVTLGNNAEDGEVLQAVIPANSWFAARLIKPEDFALVSCTVSPGFDFADFELAERDKMLHDYPALRDIIIEFTR